MEWVRRQPGHGDWRFLNWSDVLVVRDGDGSIRCICEMAHIQTADFVFDVSRKARETHRTWNAVCAYFDEHGIRPLIIVSSGSKLVGYARMLMQKAFQGFEFFRR